MNDPAEPQDPRLVELQARVEALEAALVQRSRELRALQRVLGERELGVIARIAAGRWPTSLEDANNPFEVETWRERATLQKAEVRQVLTKLWRVVARDLQGG